MGHACTCTAAYTTLCVNLLWDSVLLDPGVDLSQFLSLFLGEPGLERLKHPEFLPVLCQHLILFPGVDLICHHNMLGRVLDHAPQ